jgi:hypothetical protein
MGRRTSKAQQKAVNQFREWRDEAKRKADAGDKVARAMQRAYQQCVNYMRDDYFG